MVSARKIQAGSVVQHHAAVVHEIGPVGLAVGAVFQKLVPGLGKKALERVHLELQHRAFIDVARPVDAHVAGGVDQIVRLVIGSPVGLQHHVALAHHGVAVDHRVQVRPAQDVVAAEKRGHLLAHGQRNLLLQQGAGLELERSIGILRMPGRRQQRHGHPGHGCQGKAAGAGRTDEKLVHSGRQVIQTTRICRMDDYP